MSTDDRDLAAAFEELTAPPSTAGYATRVPAVGIAGASRRWPQTLAGALVVVVTLAGAGTFLALRTARQGGGSAGSSGTPAARADAAMAFDSTSGVTVLYGGTGSSGHALADTWTWDGSSWRSAAGGPPALVNARLVDDPADRGVLLLGMAAPPANGSGGGSGNSGSSGTVCVGVGTASPASTGTTSSSLMPAATTAAPTAPASPPSTCAPVPPPAVAQTWLFAGGGWTHVAAGSSAATPPAGAQLAFDAVSRQVVAVEANAYLGCSPPRAPASDGGYVCPALGAPSSTDGQPAIACAVPLGCSVGGTVSTWTFSGESWRTASGGALKTGGVTLLFSDPATSRATLMARGGVDGAVNLCNAGGLCPASTVPATTTWSWSGSGWQQVSQVSSTQVWPSLDGGSTGLVAGHIVVLTAGGDTWTFAAGQWTQDNPSTHPSGRSGAAMAEGPGRTVVLFGGFSYGGVAVSSNSAQIAPLGSDTWTWDGSAWKHVSGTAPSAPPAPSVCPALKSGAIPPCVGPPTIVAPATAQGQPPQGTGIPIPVAAPTP